MESRLNTMEMDGVELGEPKVARRAVAALFGLNGLLFATWVSRIPAVQSAQGLSDGTLGLALLAMALGAMLAMPFGGWLSARCGSHRVCQVAAALYCAALPLPALAPNFGVFVLVLFGFGMAHGALDIAMNAQAVEVEQRYPRPIMSSFHALFSLGGLVGALIGGVVATGGYSPLAHFTAVTVALGGGVFWWIFPRLLVIAPEAVKAEAEVAKQPFRLPPPAIWILGVAAFCVLMGEGAMADWSAIFLRRVTSSSEGMAAAGYAAFSVAMALGRFGGDALAERFGPVRLVRYGGVLAVLGMGLALLAVNPWLTLLGFIGVGAGFATVVPQIFTAAGNVPCIAAGPALATVTTMGYLGFLIGPPLIGFAAELFGLRNALGLILLTSGALIICAAWVKPQRVVQAPAKVAVRDEAEEMVLAGR